MSSLLSEVGSSPFLSTHRHHGTLVSWGINTNGECGVPGDEFSSLLVSSPALVLENQSFEHVSAGATHSAVATSGGEVYTFGKGAHGELGTGRLDPVLEASRVEHLVDHHRVRLVVAGRTCTWFLNAEGALMGSGTFACDSGYGGFGGYGGYGGYGSYERDDRGGAGEAPVFRFEHSLESLFDEEELQDDGGVQIFTGGASSSHIRGRSMMDAYGNFMRENAVNKPSPAAASSSSYPSPALQHFIPFIDHRARSIELQQSKYMFSEALRNMSEVDSAQRLWDDMSELSRFSDSCALPAMVSGGSGLLGHVVVGDEGVGSMVNALPSAFSSLSSSSSSKASFASLHACPHTGRTLGISAEGLPVVMSALKTTRALPMDAASLPASWAQACLPPPVVLSAVKENGGAIKGVVGQDWFGALCRDGRVVVWWTAEDERAGAVRQAADRERERTARTRTTTKARRVKTTKKESSVFYTQDGTTVMTLGARAGAATVRDIAASLNKLYLSDGRTVWSLPMAIGRTDRTDRTDRMDLIANANANAISGTKSKSDAATIMDGGDAGIVKLEANSRGTLAAVTDSGHVWLRGDVVSDKDLSYIIGKSDEKRGRIWEGLQSGQSGQSGRPVPVPGLHGVTDVSLGEHHALAVVAA